MKILWNEATKLSQIVAIILFVGCFALAFSLGMKYSSSQSKSEGPSGKLNPNDPALTVYECADGRSVWAAYKENGVTLSLSDGSNVTLPQVASASGARFANADDSFVFWDKGGDAFVEENGTTTYADCSKKSI